MRQSLPAAIARLNSLVERYPLYSHVDDALYLLGQAYESEITIVRARPGDETAKARLIEAWTKKATDAYSKILTRYPMMERVEDAKKRLEALHRPIPTATPAAIAQNKAEEDSRRTPGMLSHVMSGFKKHPDVAQATKVGEPTIVDTKVMSGRDVVTSATQAMLAPGGGGSIATVEIKNGAPPPPNEAAPRSDAPPAGNAVAPPAAPDPNELTPNAPADSNELKVEPADSGSQALPPPAQVNEVQSGASEQSSDKSSSSTANATSSPAIGSSSKPKKKKGLHKLIPF